MNAYRLPLTDGTFVQVITDKSRAEIMAELEVTKGWKFLKE